MIRSSYQIQLTYGRHSRRLHQYPAFDGSGAQERETILYLGCLGHVGVRFAPLDPPGLIRP